jgi:RNA polymerase subunit RPABC4/transcription elongation factor Spt4
MTIKDVLFDQPIKVIAISVTKAKFCADCNVIVEDNSCPLCASKTHQIIGVNLSKNSDWSYIKPKEVHNHGNHNRGTPTGCKEMEVTTFVDGRQCPNVVSITGDWEHDVVKIINIGKGLAK